jgi:hypothetical protein
MVCRIVQLDGGEWGDKRCRDRDFYFIFYLWLHLGTVFWDKAGSSFIRSDSWDVSFDPLWRQSLWPHHSWRSHLPVPPQWRLGSNMSVGGIQVMADNMVNVGFPKGNPCMPCRHRHLWSTDRPVCGVTLLHSNNLLYYPSRADSAHPTLPVCSGFRDRFHLCLRSPVMV